MNEDNWIKALATKERERRARIEAFQSAVPTFVEGLVKALKLDIAVYENEFPSERVGLESEPHRGSIHIVNHSYQPSPQAKILCHSGRQELSCDFESTGHHHSSWIEKLETSAAGLHLTGISVEYSAKELSKRILLPILFPAPL